LSCFGFRERICRQAGEKGEARIRYQHRTDYVPHSTRDTCRGAANPSSPQWFWYDVSFALPAGSAMNKPYEIETDQDSIVIRLPRTLADDEGFVRFLDYREMQDIRQRSELPEDDAETLAAEVKRDAWQRVRHLFADEGDE
jgi:hypothetical protein